MNNREKIIAAFQDIKRRGFIPSHRTHDTGIGKTFEDLIGIIENNERRPDLNGYEIKTKRETSTSYSTLFTKSPSYPKRANAYLRNRYGEDYEEFPGLKKIHTSIFAHQGNSCYGVHSFRLVNDRDCRRIAIAISSLQTGEIFDDAIYYTYDDIEYALKKKLDKLLFVFADTAILNGREHFHYKRAEIYENPSLENFLGMVDEGKIMYDIRIGSYKNPAKRNYGKPHDHGSGFRIRPVDLTSLYADQIIVE